MTSASIPMDVNLPTLFNCDGISKYFIVLSREKDVILLNVITRHCHMNRNNEFALCLD